MQTEYEVLADLRCQGVRLTERKCRKLRMGQVSFSLEIHMARTSIYAWSMIKKKAKGLRVSSRLLTFNKACLPYNLKHAEEHLAGEHLAAAYKHYYSIKGSHKELRKSATENRAEALAAEGRLDKVKVLKEICERENQRSTARKIRYLHGKISTGSTTIVMINDVHGNKVDLTNKEDIKRAIITNNESKYKQSFHTPFLQPPLVRDFGFQGLTPASQQVLAGYYIPEESIDPYVQDIIKEWATPQPIKDLGPQHMEISVQNYRQFWKKS
jgi:hypothetical protein